MLPNLIDSDHRSFLEFELLTAIIARKRFSWNHPNYRPQEATPI